MSVVSKLIKVKAICLKCTKAYMQVATGRPGFWGWKFEKGVDSVEAGKE
jgi:hypothetical protein